MAVPARAIAERRIAEYFLSHDAVRPDSAIAYETARPIRARAFERRCLIVADQRRETAAQS